MNNNPQIEIILKLDNVLCNLRKVTRGKDGIENLVTMLIILFKIILYLYSLNETEFLKMIVDVFFNIRYFIKTYKSL